MVQCATTYPQCELRGQMVRNIANINKLLILTAVLTPLVIAPGTGDHFYYPKILAVYIAVAGMMVIHVFSPDRKKVAFDLPVILLASYLTLVFLASLFSIDIARSMWGTPRREEGLFALVAYALLFVFARTYYRFEKRHLTLLMGSSLLVATYGIMQYYGFDPVPRDFIRVGWRNAFSTIGNPNFLASYLVLLLSPWVFVFLHKGKYIHLLTAAVLYFTLLLTMARSGLVGMLPILVLAMYYSYCNAGARRRFGVLLVLFVLIAAVFNASQDGAFVRRVGTIATDAGQVIAGHDDAYRAGSNRFYIWTRTWNFVMDRPLLGYGPETLDIIFIERHSEEMLRLFNAVYAMDKAHNEYLHIAVSSGIPAALLYLSFALSVLWRAWCKRSNLIVLVVATAIVGYMTQAFFNISVVSVAYLFWILLGVLDGQERMRTSLGQPFF